MKETENKEQGDSLNKKLVDSGNKLIMELKKLFTAMSVSNKKYLDPSGVLSAIVSD